jgi:hypothetical protein
MHACSKIASFEKSAEEESSSAALTKIATNIEKMGVKETLFIFRKRKSSGCTARRVAEVEVEKHWLRNSP